VVRCGDVRGAQVEDGFLRRAARLLGEHQPRTATIEECESAERIQMRHAQYVAIPSLGDGDVTHRAGDLSDRFKLRVAHRCTPVAGQGAIAGRTKPGTQGPAIAQPEFGERIRDVKLDCVDAHSAPPRDLSIRQAVLDSMHGAPFAGRQQVGVSRSAARALHASHPKPSELEFPYPGCPPCKPGDPRPEFCGCLPSAVSWRTDDFPLRRFRDQSP